MKAKPKASIIIVHYRKFDLLINCINSIYKSKSKVNFEIIVVDNDNKKTIDRKLKKKFPKVKYVRSSDNIGYGAGNNLGAKNAKGDYLLILNPDTLLYPKTIDKLVNFIKKNNDTAVVAPNFYHKNGKLFEYQGSRTLTPMRAVFALSFINKYFPNNPVSKKYYLKDLSFDEERQVDSVPGSCFLIKKKVFEKVGGFDENFFLFFEEADMFKRIKELGYKIYMIPKAKVVHLHKKSTPKTNRIENIFKTSRFKYLKKHFGPLRALVVEGFLRFSKQHFLLILILLTAAFLRLYKLNENMNFHGELGHVYLELKNYIIEGKIPLIGPATSHPWLNFGPIYYWILSPIFIVFNFEPIAPAYFMSIIGTLVVIINYFYVSKLMNGNIGIISSFLIAISPLFYSLSKGFMLFSFVVVAFYPFWFYLVKSVKENGKYLFWTGVFFGIMLNFHLTPIILIPAVITVIYLYKSRFTKRNIINGVLGLIIPNVPLLIYDSRQGFVMFTKLFLWIPYRFAGFLGLYPKNTVSFQVLIENLDSFYEFVTSAFVKEHFGYAFVVFAIFLSFLLLYMKSVINSKKRDAVGISLLTILFWGCLGIFIHGNPPSHYYLPLYPIPIIIASYYLDRIKSRFGLQILLILLVLLTFNKIDYYSNILINYSINGEENGHVSYQLQNNIAKRIIDDSGSRPFELARVGVLDDYKDDFADNYRYLLWLKGNEPVIEGELIIDKTIKPEIKYTIYEEEHDIPDFKKYQIIWEENIAIVKEEL